MELDTTTTATPTAEDTSGKVEAAKVEAPAQAAPKVTAPKLEEPSVYFKAARDKKEQAASQVAAQPDPAPTPEKAPVSAVAAPEPAAVATTPTTTTAPTPELTVEQELAKAKERIQQFEQAREVAEVQQLTARQQADLAADKALLDRTVAARDRKVTQCQQILAQLSEAESDGDYEAIKELNARYAEAYDEAHILENTAARYDKELGAKSRYFNDQFAKTRESENTRTLDAIFKPYGLNAKEVLSQVPEQFKSNSFAVLDTALKTLTASKDAEIADLKKQLSEVETAANAKARDKWDSSNPAREPHKNVSGGASGSKKWSPNDKGSDWFRPVNLSR